jgi:hypothetical protein
MATVALSTLVDTLQTFLRDTDAKKWTEVDLAMFINLAITQWTTDLPIASANSYDVVSDQHEYTLPENTVKAVSVYGYFESSTTQEWLSSMKLRPGSFDDNDEPRRFIVGFPTESQFYLPRVPRGSTFTLYYKAKHSPLVLGTDALDLRQEAWGELAVLYYASYLCYMPYAANRARLEQWGRKGDLNVGNPLAEQAMRYKLMYEELLEENSGSEILEFVRSERI